MLNTAAATARIALLASALALAPACVSQTRYDEAIQELQYYQRSYHDLDSYSGQLQAQVAELQAKLKTQGNGGAVDASFPGDIDARLAELKGIVQKLGAEPDDVEVLKVEGGYGLRMNDAVLFDSGQATLRPEGRDLVLRLANEIRSHPFRKVEVRGHTDSTPVKKPETLQRFPHGNLELSAERAVQVAALLVEEGGVDASKVVVSGYGPNDPIAANDTDANRQRNRRVELFVLD